jgi:hypothetical protein
MELLTAASTFELLRTQIKPLTGLSVDACVMASVRWSDPRSGITFHVSGPGPPISLDMHWTQLYGNWSLEPLPTSDDGWEILESAGVGTLVAKFHLEDEYNPHLLLLAVLLAIEMFWSHPGATRLLVETGPKDSEARTLFACGLRVLEEAVGVQRNMKWITDIRTAQKVALPDLIGLTYRFGLEKAMVAGKASLRPPGKPESVFYIADGHATPLETFIPINRRIRVAHRGLLVEALGHTLVNEGT